MKFLNYSNRIYLNQRSIAPRYRIMKLTRSAEFTVSDSSNVSSIVSYGPPLAYYLGGYQDRLLGRPLGLLGLCHTAPYGVRRKDYGGEVLG
jgi:hypothetical protein